MNSSHQDIVFKCPSLGDLTFTCYLLFLSSTLAYTPVLVISWNCSISEILKSVIWAPYPNIINAYFKTVSKALSPLTPPPISNFSVASCPYFLFQVDTSFQSFSCLILSFPFLLILPHSHLKNSQSWVHSGSPFLPLYLSLVESGMHLYISESSSFKISSLTSAPARRPLSTPSPSPPQWYNFKPS